MATKGPQFDEDQFDFQPIQHKQSMVSNVLDMTKSLTLSRPFLIAVITFLLYQLWTRSRKGGSKNKVLELVNLDGRSSMKSENRDRISIRKSQRPPPAPVTAAINKQR